MPLGRVELDALQVVALSVLLELLEARLTLARIPTTVGDQLVRILFSQLRVPLERVEAFAIPRLQVRRLEDADVDVALLEHVLDEVLLGVLLELLKRPVRLRRPEALIGVEALDPPLRVLLLALHPVRRTRVPEMDVTIDNEVLLTIPLVHMSSLTRRLDDQSQCTPRRPCSRVPASLESGIELEASARSNSASPISARCSRMARWIAAAPGRSGPTPAPTISRQNPDSSSDSNHSGGERSIAPWKRSIACSPWRSTRSSPSRSRIQP